jgi:hypothetical protein
MKNKTIHEEHDSSQAAGMQDTGKQEDVEVSKEKADQNKTSEADATYEYCCMALFEFELMLYVFILVQLGATNYIVFRWVSA